MTSKNQKTGNVDTQSRAASEPQTGISAVEQLPPLSALALLPGHRQLALLYCLAGPRAGGLDPEDVDRYVRERSARECLIPRNGEMRVIVTGDTIEVVTREPDLESRSRVAVLGSDGRYHQQIDGRFSCTPEDDPADGPFHHRQLCSWDTATTGYRAHHPAIGDDVTWTEVTWLMSATQITAVPSVVPPRERCPVNISWGDWPRHIGGKMAKAGAILLKEYGDSCSVCRYRAGECIDHDHLTGYVRGLLCNGCNHLVDLCPHTAGCRYADYLNDPPASRLRLRSPKQDKTLRDQKQLMQQLGISSLDELWTRHRNADQIIGRYFQPAGSSG